MANTEDTNFDSVFDNDSEYIIIPNPIYDVVFRYLMEDEQSAIIIISTLINEKILSLELQPLTHSEKKYIPEDENGEEKEFISELKYTSSLTGQDIRLFHLDFKAVIEVEGGDKEVVMIELQKASELNDIFRFKRYISRNFQQKQQKEIIDSQTGTIQTIKKPMRLIPIFILNFRIENEINDLVIKINRVKEGVFKGKNLLKHNDFIDNLSYDMYVVQLPNLQRISEEEYKNDEYKSKLYSLLKLFDQKSTIKNNEHRLRVMRRFFPEFMKRVIRRLQAADINNPDLEEKMFIEDEYLQALIEKDNKINFLEQKAEKAQQTIVKKEEELNQKNEVINQKEQELSQKEEELNQKNEFINQKEEELSQKEKIILDYAIFLKSQGVSAEDIQQKTNLSIERINNL